MLVASQSTRRWIDSRAASSSAATVPVRPVSIVTIVASASVSLPDYTWPFGWCRPCSQSGHHPSGGRAGGSPLLGPALPASSGRGGARLRGPVRPHLGQTWLFLGYF